jgi:hypothetical protein
MSNSLSPEDLAWLRQCAAVDGNTYSRLLLHLLERVESLEKRPIPGTVELAAPTPEAVPVAWGNFRQDGTCVGLTERFEDTTRWLNPRPLFLSFRLPVAQPPAAQPAPPAAPAGGLVQRVEARAGGDARAAIREVAAWIHSELNGRLVADRLEQEADR